jgi:hypothetical protein
MADKAVASRRPLFVANVSEDRRGPLGEMLSLFCRGMKMPETAKILRDRCGSSVSFTRPGAFGSVQDGVGRSNTMGGESDVATLARQPRGCAVLLRSSSALREDTELESSILSQSGA